MASFRDLEGVDLRDVELVTSRLRLRPWRVDDADAVATIMADGVLLRFLPVPDPYTPSDAREFVTQSGQARRRSGIGLDCAVIAAGGLVASAWLGLDNPEGTAAHIGYWTAPEAQRRGYASEAAGALAEWGFAHGVHRIEIGLDVRNVASAKTAMRSGFAFEGVRREDFPLRGEHTDSAVFVRTADDDGHPITPAFPELDGGRLSDGVISLRCPTKADSAAFAEQESDPLTVGVGFTGVAPSRRQSDRLLARAGLDRLVGPALGFTIVDDATERFAGSMRLRTLGPPGIGSLGYVVHPAFRGRGYAARALRLLSSWAFDRAGLARLELGAKVDNVASQHAARAAGFTQEGVFGSRLRNPDGGYSDEVRFALVNPRYASAASPPSRISP